MAGTQLRAAEESIRIEHAAAAAVDQMLVFRSMASAASSTDDVGRVVDQVRREAAELLAFCDMELDRP